MFQVRRKIRAAVITTGEELMPHGSRCFPEKSNNANLAYLTGRLLQLDCNLTEGIFVGDDADKITAAVEKCAEEADVILTTGGCICRGQRLIAGDYEETGCRHFVHGIV